MERSINAAIPGGGAGVGGAGWGGSRVWVVTVAFGDCQSPLSLRIAAISRRRAYGPGSASTGK